MENELTERAAKNTDREIWRRKSPDSLDPDGYYQPSIHVTEGGGIGMNVGGTVVVMPIEQWHQLALRSKQQAERTPGIALWGDPSGNIHRMGGDQEVIAISTEDCTDAEWLQMCNSGSDAKPPAPIAAPPLNDWGTRRT